MSLSGEEFIRRFLLHVLPKGLVRIRHYGFLANRCRKSKLATIRASIEQSQESEPETDTAGEKSANLPGIKPCLCPKCKQGVLQVIAGLPVWRMPGGERRQPLH